MKEETKEQISLARYKAISPVLAEPGRLQNDYFRGLAEQEHDFPHYGRRRYAVSTYKGWLKAYLDEGFEGLKPLTRSDCGDFRKLNDDVLDVIRTRWAENELLSARLLHEHLVAANLLGDPPATYNTVVRALHREGLLPRPNRTDVRKRFEVAEVNDLWTGDFMHGPRVLTGRQLRKAILCAIIDDHSRLLVGYAFDVQETLSALAVVLKDAMLTYGVPKRLYLDNGAAFSADLLIKACAQARISLTHSKPYDAPSRGKIERFFKTVRERFLPGLQGTVSLDDINLAFSCWLREEYHQRVHSTTGQRPVDRYHASAGRIQIRRLSAHELDEFFLVRDERVVNNDATISLKGKVYEVPGAYIRQRIEIRHPVDDPDDLALFDKGQRVCRLKLVNSHENSRTFKPHVEDTAISFADKKVKS